ncbi:MAG: GNAT family N-acetyltransferase [Alphaproteobacteria bacterium]|nr:GNAT family N-acetyltransferase [Alphaproteobacteria bacterium]
MTYSFRTGDPSDALACAKIIRDWGDESPWLDPLDDLQTLAAFWRGVFEKDLVWVAEENGVIVGFCVREDEFICGLYVDREARCCGVGRRLLDLAKFDRDWIIVWAYEANMRARKFYRREGLVEICRELEKDTNLMNVEHRWTRSK